MNDVSCIDVAERGVGLDAKVREPWRTIVWRRLGLGSLVAHALTPGVVSQCRETIAELVLIGTLQCVISACAIGGFISGVGGKLGQRKVVGDSCSRGQNLRRRVQRVVVVIQVTAKGSHTADLEG